MRRFEQSSLEHLAHLSRKVPFRKLQVLGGLTPEEIELQVVDSPSFRSKVLRGSVVVLSLSAIALVVSLTFGQSPPPAPPGASNWSTPASSTDQPIAHGDFRLIAPGYTDRSNLTYTPLPFAAGPYKSTEDRTKIETSPLFKAPRYIPAGYRLTRLGGIERL